MGSKLGQIAKLFVLENRCVLSPRLSYMIKVRRARRKIDWYNQLWVYQGEIAASRGIWERGVKESRYYGVEI